MEYHPKYLSVYDDGSPNALRSPMSLGARIPARYGRGALPHERRPSLGAWGGHLRRRRRRAPKSPDPKNLLLPQQLEQLDMLS